MSRGFLDRFRRAVEDGKNEAATAMFFREMVGMDEEALSAFQSTPAWQQWVPRAWTVVREMQAMLDAGQTFECYGSVSVPTLLLVGTETPEDDVLTTHRLHAVMPDSRVGESHGQGHMAYLRALELIASEVARFLTTIADT